MLRFLPSVTIVVLGLGCGSAIDTWPDAAPDAGPDAAPRTNVLEIEGPDRLALVFGEEAVVGVRYLGPSREPLAERLVSFAFDGRAHDSSLRALDVQTDATGFAQTTLVAGSTPAAFRVRITAEGAEPAFVDVSVSDEGFGQLVVELAYEGAREVTTLGAAVFAGLTCEDEATQTEPGDRYRARGEGDEVLFVGLPAGLEYAVVARGEGPGGDLLAWGCVDGVALEAGGRVRTAVVAEDLPQRGRGSYQTTLAFEPSQTVGQLAAEIDAVAAELPSDATLILDGVERALQASGDTEGLAAFTGARSRSDADANLGGLLESAGVGPSVALQGLQALVEDRAQRVEFTGSLRVADEISLRVVRFAVGTADALYEVDASTVGGVATELLSSVDARGETLAVERLSMDLRASAVVTVVAAASLGPTGAPEVSPLEAALSTLARCDETPELTELASICDAACLASACSEALKFIVMDLELRFEAVDRERGRIVSRGDLSLVDDSADLEVDRIEGGLEGEWTGDASPTPERLDLEVAGERLTPPG